MKTNPKSRVQEGPSVYSILTEEAEGAAIKDGNSGSE